MADKQLDQAKYRRNQVATDQFGRRWSQIIELSTGDPTCGNGTPFGWDDPLATPDYCITVPRDEYGMPVMGKIEIDFDRWIAELEESWDDWYQVLLFVGKKNYKKSTPEEVKKWPEDEYLLEEAGPVPGEHLLRWATEGETPVDVLKRARDGDEILLGLRKPGSGEQEMTWQTFLTQKKKEGITDVKEISALWRLRKEERLAAVGEGDAN
jgi:hypothetical protein